LNFYIAVQNGDLTSLKGKSIVVEFSDGKILELMESPGTLPPAIQDGIHVWCQRRVKSDPLTSPPTV